MSIDPKKEKLLNKFMELAKGKTIDDILPLLLAVNEKARSEGIQFSYEETMEIINTMKKDATMEQAARIDTIVSMFNQAKNL